jgi:hypothetical protein
MQRDIEMTRTAYYIIAVFFIVAGCATLESSLERRLELFEVASFKFENALRWGYFERAYDFIRSDAGDAEKPDFEKLRDLKISSYEVTKSTLSVNELTAEETVEIEYYSLQNLLEKRLVHTLLWEFDTETDSWYITSSFPDLKP